MQLISGSLNSWWQQLLEKIYGLLCQNGVMVSDSPTGKPRAADNMVSVF